MTLTDVHVAYHRNGVMGTGFHVVLFTWKDEQGTPHRMQGIVFPEPGSCAVTDIEETARGNIAFAQGNSWRGDHFEPELRAIIATVCSV